MEVLAHLAAFVCRIHALPDEEFLEHLGDLLTGITSNLRCSSCLDALVQRLLRIGLLILPGGSKHTLMYFRLGTFWNVLHASVINKID